MAKYQIPIEECQERAKYYIDNFNDIIRSLDHSTYSMANIDPQRAKRVSEFYFLANYAYKDLRGIKDNHHTEFSKVAALTAISICNIGLLGLNKKDAPETEITLMFNPMFAVRCACSRLNINLVKLNFEERDRIYRSFKNINLICSNDYFLSREVNKHNIGDEIEFNLHDEDIRIIEDKISLFHFLEIAMNGPLISTR